MRTVPFLVLALGMSALSAQAEAKDLRNRLAVGFENPTLLLGASQTAPAQLSLKVTLGAEDKTVNMQIQVLAGAAWSSESALALQAGGRFLYTVIAEDNANVFVGMGAAFILPGDFTNRGVLRAQPLVGVEFFLFGLENLGLSASLGLSVDMDGSGVALQTGASSLGNVGVHYYF